ncbi:hypothetical protein V500_02683 [Pseudogymnoascus sp. VKM F-4518 (FW-2643)]|nr:hypothetical protein V500_02683 [Pseudogymnoascus sp. VKM F-4518 (FW-2643)]
MGISTPVIHFASETEFNHGHDYTSTSNATGPFRRGIPRRALRTISPSRCTGNRISKLSLVDTVSGAVRVVYIRIDRSAQTGLGESWPVLCDDKKRRETGQDPSPRKAIAVRVTKSHPTSFAPNTTDSKRFIVLVEEIQPCRQIPSRSVGSLLYPVALLEYPQVDGGEGQSNAILGTEYQK